MGFFEKFRSGRKDEDSVARQTRIMQEEAGRQAADTRWRQAKQAVEGRPGDRLASPDIPGVPVEDPYGRAARMNLERLEAGLPVPDAELQGTGAVNPSTIGEARIQRSVFGKEDAAGSGSGSVLSPEMDAYIQNQMMEEAAAEEARGRDPKSGAEN